MLKSRNNSLKFQAIHVLANLAKIDTTGRFEKVFNQFYDIVNGDALIPACHVAYVSHKIVKAKPELADKITERLLNLDKATYKHKELVQANALSSFSEYFDRISDKEKIVSLAKELQKNKSSRAKKEATEFLRKWNIK
jgi:ABC-type phosphate/phosphonate transport system substrate-binding protein